MFFNNVMMIEKKKKKINKMKLYEMKNDLKIYKKARSHLDLMIEDLERKICVFDKQDSSL